MALAEKLKSRNLIVASGSPRRQQFIKDLGLDFEIRLRPVQETYPESLDAVEIAEHLAKLKAAVFLEELKPKDILITGDTIVYHEDKVLNKPKSEEEAFAMLERLSGKSHEVISSTCLTSTEKYVLLHGVTKVYFKELTPEEINYYIKYFKPFDKAGAYGIQEWIGKIGIEKIEGSFYNVMGMPVDKVYEALKGF